MILARDQMYLRKNGRDSDLEQIENDFQAPEDRFWEKNNSEGILRDS